MPTLFFLFIFFNTTLACWWWYSQGSRRPTTPKPQVEQYEGKHLSPELYNGWPPNDDMKDLIKKYGKNKDGYIPGYEGKIPHGAINPDEEGSDWPQDWKNMGPGWGGLEPPPWAYVPNSIGKPSLCFLPPQYGTCQGKELRYAYNPYADDCQKFTYSGCGGNQNNFREYKKCQGKCLEAVEGGCVEDSGIMDVHD